MNVVGLADIDRHNETSVGCRESTSPLCCAHVTPGFVGGFRFCVAIVGQLNDAQGKITLTPTLPPGLDHDRQKDAVLLSACFIRFALVPEGAAQREGN